MSSQGPTTCNSGSSSAWANPNGVTGTGGAATINTSGSANTPNLVATWNGGDFSIPLGATVQGILISATASIGQPDSTLTDTISLGSNTYSVSGSVSGAAVNWGGSTDLWGAGSIAPASVNGSWTATFYGTSTHGDSWSIQTVQATVYYALSDVDLYGGGPNSVAFLYQTRRVTFIHPETGEVLLTFRQPRA